jgi:hypothetical protein
MVALKLCPTCGLTKPTCEFHAAGGTRTRPRCKPCERAAMRVETDHACTTEGCEEFVVVPGPCGFCREEAGERPSAPSGPSPLTAHENRRTVALAAAGAVSYDLADNLGR